MKKGVYILFLSFLALQSCTVLDNWGIIDYQKPSVVTELGESSSIPDETVFDCGYIYHGTDYRINEYRIETDYKELFSYTHNHLKPYFPEGHFMECYSSLAKLGESNYMYLKIFFNTGQADKSYGSIIKGEHLRIVLMDGEKIFLESMSNAVPVKKKSGSQIIYDGIFSVSNTELSALKSVEVDRLGIIWSYGYEEYDIKNIELLKNQAHCLTQSSHSD